ncbi:MAG: hypothetical protein NDJ90_09640 [Oligoflexia bacterium]|nr:hypothetical protein [Oligoflexia bacterium]
MKSDWRWSDQFMPEVKAILGRHLFAAASLSVDRNEACDLITPTGRIAVRIRRPAYRQFQTQFTLRSGRDSGSKAEFEKIIDGHGDYLFYAFESGERPGALGVWHLISLRALRANLIRRTSFRDGVQSNTDGTHFHWFDLKSFPAEPAILIASNHPELGKERGQ